MDFFYFYVCLCYIILSVSCSLVVTCWEKDDCLTFLYMMFSCEFVTFPYDILGKMWYLIVSTPDLCPFPYLNLLKDSANNMTCFSQKN